MTAGADGTTIDGMSDERIQRIIESMRDKSYLPKPARREYIAKKNSNKKRPLGIQSGNDKLVQEVVKMILENISWVQTKQKLSDSIIPDSENLYGNELVC